VCVCVCLHVCVRVHVRAHVRTQANVCACVRAGNLVDSNCSCTVGIVCVRERETEGERGRERVCAHMFKEKTGGGQETNL